MDREMRKVMKRAHELAKGMEGDYQARMSLALRIAWKEAKEMGEKTFRIKKWFAERSMLYVPLGSDVLEVKGEILRETEKALLIKAYYPNKRTERGGKKFYIIEGWFPKSVTEVLSGEG
ncbi:MAG: hypothetical protein FWJ68_15510 [Planifilum fulgidum]